MENESYNKFYQPLWCSFKIQHNLTVKILYVIGILYLLVYGYYLGMSLCIILLCKEHFWSLSWNMNFTSVYCINKMLIFAVNLENCMFYSLLGQKNLQHIKYFYIVLAFFYILEIVYVRIKCKFKLRVMQKYKNS